MSLREIVEAPNVKDDLGMYRRNYPEIDQIYDEAKLVLQDNPFEGDSIEEGSGFRRYLTPATDNTPGFLIYYAYDIDHVYLHRIKKVVF